MLKRARERIVRRSRKDSKDADGDAFPQYRPETIKKRTRKGKGTKPNLTFSGQMWRDFRALDHEVRRHSIVILLGLPRKYDRRVKALSSRGFWWLQMTSKQLRRLAADTVKSGILKLKKR